MRPSCSIAIVAWALLAACGGDGQGGAVPAGAFERPNQDEAIAKLEAVKRAADADAQERAEAEEAQLRALVDAVTIVADPKPRSLAVACKEAAAAMDALVQRQFASDADGLGEW